MATGKVVKTDELDPQAVAYAKLTDKQAKERVQLVKDRIKEIKGKTEVSKDPRLIFELRELTASLAWYKANKNRSKFFRMDSLGPSMRQANRHPHGRGLGDKDKSRHKREEV